MRIQPYAQISLPFSINTCDMTRRPMVHLTRGAAGIPLGEMATLHVNLGSALGYAAWGQHDRFPPPRLNACSQFRRGDLPLRPAGGGRGETRRKRADGGRTADLVNRRYVCR